MQFTSFLTLALASVAAAAPDFAIGTPTLITPKDRSELAALTKALYEAASSYQASLTAQPEWSSAFSALKEFQTTATMSVPSDVTATDKILTFATTPDWFHAMPTDLQKYLENNMKNGEELIASVVKKTTGDAARPLGMGIYISGAVAALVGGVAAVL
ncbi:hypothetical protein C7974DRAFT_384074 [Boeremia exigua]|uniref:uncharacterized protein n=1 Tax=Boeremia exigua TaxID=749465 RepID=UPI001E8CC4AD|nr:uncharacterized protein C7974DRAFT_384074 [Boeremia exigua]KAH6644672.1 hypothetical protein C7974DRAFT_384074 [Boeremia exigua]